MMVTIASASNQLALLQLQGATCCLRGALRGNDVESAGLKLVPSGHADSCSRSLRKSLITIGCRANHVIRGAHRQGFSWRLSPDGSRRTPGRLPEAASDSGAGVGQEYGGAAGADLGGEVGQTPACDSPLLPGGEQSEAQEKVRTSQSKWKAKARRQKRRATTAAAVVATAAARSADVSVADILGALGSVGGHATAPAPMESKTSVTSVDPLSAGSSPLWQALEGLSLQPGRQAAVTGRTFSEGGGYSGGASQMDGAGQVGGAGTPGGDQYGGNSGDPYGRKVLGKAVVQWLALGTFLLAEDLIAAEKEGRNLLGESSRAAVELAQGYLARCLGGLHLVTLRPGRGQRLPPTTISPGDMVCVRIESRAAEKAGKLLVAGRPGDPSSLRGSVYSLGDDNASLAVAVETRYGDPVFSKLFGKLLRLDRISPLVDATTYDRNREALERLSRQGLQQKSPCHQVVLSLFGPQASCHVAERPLSTLVEPEEAEVSADAARAALFTPGADTMSPSVTPGALANVPPIVTGEGSGTLKEEATEVKVEKLEEEEESVAAGAAGPGALTLRTPAAATTVAAAAAAAEFDASQDAAIRLALDSATPVAIIQGPPGTGKTSVVAEIVARATARGDRVLAAAPTNAAVDNLVERLASLGLSVVRVGNPARVAPSVAQQGRGERRDVEAQLATFRRDVARRRADLRADLRQCGDDAEIVGGIRAMLKQLAKAAKLREKEAVELVLTSAQVVLCTAAGAGEMAVRRQAPFEMVVLDEAAQATEPSSWLPLLLGKKVVLAGDTCQLAPTILSREALQGGLGISLMERAAGVAGGAVRMLQVQYRMHAAIADWASGEMYEGKLRSSPGVSERLLLQTPGVEVTWSTNQAMVVLDTRMPRGSLLRGCEEQPDPLGSGSLVNEGEADIVVSHVHSLLSAGVKPQAIAVQSPYLAQVQLLQSKLEDLPGGEGVEVASVDSFQGREADAVIISMVRSNAMGAVGFLGDSRRMNVAITRARCHVAVVCDSTTVSRNPFLRRLLQHIRQRGEIRSAASQLEHAQSMHLSLPVSTSAGNLAGVAAPAGAQVPEASGSRKLLVGPGGSAEFRNQNAKKAVFV
eukprot:jgi/Mesen1/5530/ME000279S04740